MIWAQILLLSLMRYVTLGKLISLCLRSPNCKLRLIRLTSQSCYEACGCSVAKLPQTLCDPTDCSTPDSSVLHYLLGFAQIQIHWVGDAFQSSHPLLSPLPSVFPSIKVFLNEPALHIWWPKYWSFQLQHQSFQWIFRVDFFQDWLVWSPCSPRDSQESSECSVSCQLFHSPLHPHQETLLFLLTFCH